MESTATGLEHMLSLTASNTASPRRQQHACERCRTRHQKCTTGSDPGTCANCELADVSCHTGLRIKFSKIGPSRGKRQRGASSTQRRRGSSPPPARGRASSGDASRLGSEDEVPTTGRKLSSEQRLSDADRAPQVDQTAQGDATPQAAGTHDSPVAQDDERSPLAIETLPYALAPPISSIEPSPQPQHSAPLFDAPRSATVATESVAYNSPGMGLLSHADVSFHSGQSPLDLFRPSSGHSDLACFWSLNQNEAHLIKHFFTFLVYWFDYCDPQMNFRSYVGSTMSKDIELLYAVLAISARHLELTQGLPGNKSDEYQQNCLQILIPSLNDATKALPDTIMASALLLRLLEEMTEREEHQPTNAHGLSTAILIKVKAGNVQDTAFSNAAMIVALRQEIFLANMTRRPVEPVAAHCGIDMSLEPVSDTMWAYRMMAHTARVTSFIYSSGSKDFSEWHQLWQYVKDWNNCKPESFKPIYHGRSTLAANHPLSSSPDPKTESQLPRIYFTYDCPLAGLQYMQLSRILLLAHDPHRPFLGPGRDTYHRSQEEEIREAVRIICGAALANPEYEPARLTAGLAVAMCGELFTDQRETPELYRIVSEAETHMMWPSLMIAKRLKVFWEL